ncbi:hypothetical protein SAMN02982922_2401 [Mesorhizobium australicum]|uniref:Uncharacterized protein n=1 Tax=Mesorhizobium australicum TaxID=536018 RepID=A0A1X7NTH0_9HYPH|nr:hypothetical protein SAMN02982922_2401 [Mesorhizobium australicum]
MPDYYACEQLIVSSRRGPADHEVIKPFVEKNEGLTDHRDATVKAEVGKRILNGIEFNPVNPATRKKVDAQGKGGTVAGPAK